MRYRGTEYPVCAYHIPGYRWGWQLPNRKDNAVNNRREDNLVDAVYAVANALESLAIQVKYLGGGDNSDHRGAIEMHGMAVKTGLGQIAEQLGYQNEGVQP